MESEAFERDISVIGMNPNQPLRIYRHHLPHWRQDGVLYFVTLRLADSIPAHVLKAWEEDRREWLAVHGIPPACR